MCPYLYHSHLFDWQDVSSAGHTPPPDSSPVLIPQRRRRPASESEDEDEEQSIRLAGETSSRPRRRRCIAVESEDTDLSLPQVATVSRPQILPAVQVGEEDVIPGMFRPSLC